MGARMKKFRWVAIVGEQVALQTELPAETETTPTEVPQDETVDDLAEQVPEDPNLTTLYVYDEAAESCGLQAMGWVADIMANRLGV